MADYTFIEMKEWFYNNVPKIINEKYFLYVMGSIFLLGIFTKWLAAFGYGRMIRKAEHMSNPKNATLRQIKMKYDSIKEINGHVANPMIFAARIPAFKAPLMATVATGIPGGIWQIEKSASMPSSAFA